MSRTFFTHALVQAAKRTPLSRGKVRKLTLGLIESIHPDPIQADFRGVPFLFHLDNTTEKKALISDRYDKLELNFLRDSLGSRPATFVDAGANSGLYSIFLASHLSPGSRVVAVEPNPAMCKRIASNAQLLKHRGLARGVSIEVEAVALGACEGELYLDLRGGPGAAFLEHGKTENSFPVQVETLPALCRAKGIKEIQAMKIDVEGYEDRVLLPLLSDAERSLLPRALVFETVHRDAWEQDAIAACVEAGYLTAGRSRSSIMMTLRL
jgi:FkbM family methyltransferase